ncbi:MAG TPA: hypothetical protein VK421_10480 [Pyrinomonadaceae bacterium]|nr:hypothetical protein [Pyrinomonadaceae bacterium]
MKNMLRGAAILLALTLAPVLTASAQGTKGRGHGRGGGRVRDDITTVHTTRRNTTPRTPRRVRRGRNTTPGVRRGPIASTATITTPRRTRTRAGAAVALERGSGHGRIHARGRRH